MTIHVGVIGLGYWGPNLARVINMSASGVLAAICDSEPDRLERAARAYPQAATHTDPTAMLSDSRIKAVVIATPAHTHFDLAKASLEAGKHVMVEKPLAQTVAQAEQLVTLADRLGLILMPAHVFLYNAAVQQVRNYIESGELGDIYYAYSQRLNLGQVRQDVNALWNFAPHDVSILQNWFAAIPERVVAAGYSYIQPGIEDVVFMSLQYADGRGANAHISWLDPQKVRLMTVVGSKKMVVYDDTSPDERIRLIDKGVTRRFQDGKAAPGGTLGTYESFAEFQLLLRAGDVLIPRIDFREPLQLEVDDFISAIERDHAPLSNAASGVEVVRVLEAAQRSLDLRGVPVDV